MRIPFGVGAFMQVFVAHDFSNPPLRNYRKPFRIIAEKHKVDFKFADDIHTAEHLLEQIEELIASCDYCLFDVSTWNRNVFLELGFARGLKKPNALLFRPVSGVLGYLGLRSGYSDVPSDIRGLRLARYFNAGSLKIHLAELIKELLPSSDLSRNQDVFTTRVEDLIGRDSDGLTARQISDLLNIDLGMASASVRKLVNVGRIEVIGRGPHTRYRKSQNKAPTEAA